MADIILALIGLEIVTILVMIVRGVWSHLGGWPEAWYRIRKQPYFSQVIYDPQGVPSRYIHKAEIIKTQSVPAFSFMGRSWGVDEVNVGVYNGRKQYYYNWNEFRPIPVRNWRETMAALAQPDKAHPYKWEPLDPEEVYNASETKAIQKMRGIGVGKFNPWFIILLVVVVIAIIVSGVAAYYSYNAYCGLNPHACGGGGNVRLG